MIEEMKNKIEDNYISTEEKTLILKDFLDNFAKKIEKTSLKNIDKDNVKEFYKEVKDLQAVVNDNVEETLAYRIENNIHSLRVPKENPNDYVKGRLYYGLKNNFNTRINGLQSMSITDLQKAGMSEKLLIKDGISLINEMKKKFSDVPGYETLFKEVLVKEGISERARNSINNDSADNEEREFAIKEIVEKISNKSEKIFNNNSDVKEVKDMHQYIKDVESSLNEQIKINSIFRGKLGIKSIF